MLLESPLGALYEPLTGQRIDADSCRAMSLSRARSLVRQGMGSRDRVFIHYGNDAQFFIDVLAIWLAGGCVVPVDPRLTDYEIEALAKAAHPALSLWNREPSDALATTLGNLGIKILGPEQPDHGVSGDFAPSQPPLDDDALILFTSGTTGDPKGVAHTHRSLQTRWRSQREQLGTSSLGRTLFMLPTNFAWGLAGNALYVWLSGADLYILPAFRTDVLLQLGALCDDHEITYLPSVPSMWRVALRTVAPPRKGTLRRVACGTSAFPSKLWIEVRSWSGTNDVLNVYSMTECGMLATHSSAAAEPQDGLTGMPFAGVDIKVVPLGTPHSDILKTDACAHDVPGAIWARTPTLMRGYYGRDDLTAAVVSNGWFWTGDIGLLDAKGCLYLRGRDKEMINVGGVKVYPGDIDAVMERCDAVVDVCTFGLDDPMLGEQVAIAVVLKEPRDQQLGVLHRWVERHLAPFQIPRRWYLVSDIPRTARGKLNRSQVAKSCAGLTALDQRALAAAGRDFDARNRAQTGSPADRPT